MRENCPYLELFWSAFSHIWTEYGEILRISRYSVRMRENVDQSNSEYERSLRSDIQRNLMNPEPWHIQNLSHVQNSGIFRTLAY